VIARDWFVAPDGFDNPTLWERNHERPDYPIALLVRVSSNAVLFDGIVELLAKDDILAETLAMLEGLDAAWDEAGS
jgi:hypothetical protein